MTSECPITFHRRAILKTGLAASAAMALGIPEASVEGFIEQRLAMLHAQNNK